MHWASASGCERTAPVLVICDMSLLVSGDINMGLVSRELRLIIVPLWRTYEGSGEGGLSVSPVQPALLPGSPRTDGFHILIIGLPQGRDKEE